VKIPFVGPAYQARSLNADAQQAINCYLEMDNASPRAPVALYGTPGTVVRFTLGNAPIRNAITQADAAFFIAGNSVYVLIYSGGYVATLLGSINTSSGPVGLASNGTEVLIVDGSAGWVATTTTLTTITDPDFPNGVRQCTYQDGYFIVTGDGTEQFYINETPGVGTQWSGVDFASAEGSPDSTLTCISDHRELWLFGAESSEIWVNTGNPDFPFERTGNAFIQVGTAAANSVQAMDNTLYWLGRDTSGAGIVYKAQGYTPVRISTHAIEREIQSYAVISDAIAMTYEQEGHAFYVLTFPSEGKTWVYDASTGFWHQRAWRDPNLNTLHRWRPNCHIYFNNEHLVGDFETGDVYALDLDTYTDDGDPMLFLRATQCQDSDDGSRVFYDFLTVDMETGVGLATGQGSNPLIMLRWSNDGGHTWSEYRTMSIGAVGKYMARARFTRMGQGRNRVWEISITDPVKRAVIGAYTRFRKGFS
jgi:hypothetical protein